MKIAVIDNYDSFTYNLVHYLEDLGAKVTVFRNDEFELKELDAFDKIVLSPGPGIPSEAGLLKEVIQTYAKTKSILGICFWWHINQFRQGVSRRCFKNYDY